MEDEIKKLISVTSWFISLQAVTLFAFLGCAGLLYFDFQNLKQLVAATSAAGGFPPQQDVVNWKELIRSHNPTEGYADAPIVIEEFTDFQCPFCKAFNENVRGQLLSKYGDRIHMVFKHYPLEAIHPGAKLAAVAAQCAMHEGKFGQLRDILFSNADNLTQDFLLGAGASLGLSRQYAECLTNQHTLVEVEQDITDGRTAGVQGTPTFLVNGKVLLGGNSLAQFESIIGDLN